MKRTKNKMYYFMIFFISQMVSELGTSMTGFATVIWMYSNSGQVMSASLLAICSTVPYLVVSLFGGAVADKMNKKKIMLICDSIAATGSVILLSCYILGCLQLWVLCLVNVINGFMNAFQNLIGGSKRLCKNWWDSINNGRISWYISASSGNHHS